MLRKGDLDSLWATFIFTNFLDTPPNSNKGHTDKNKIFKVDLMKRNRGKQAGIGESFSSASRSR